MRRAALILALAAFGAAAATPADATVRPPVYCDPMACPDPVGGIQDCLATAAIGKDESGNPYLAGECSTRDIIWG